MAPETRPLPSGVMPHGIAIRADDPTDAPAIAALTQAAFAPMRFSDGTEAGLPEALRRDGDLTFALVTQDASGALLGHAAFSPVKLPETPGDWFALGPISVHPDHQRRGIGRALVEAGMARLAKLGAEGCVLTGNPAIYGPMGFVTDGALHHAGTPGPNVLWRSITGRPARGTITFARAFDT